MFTFKMLQKDYPFGYKTFTDYLSGLGLSIDKIEKIQNPMAKIRILNEFMGYSRDDIIFTPDKEAVEIVMQRFEDFNFAIQWHDPNTPEFIDQVASLSIIERHQLYPELFNIRTVKILDALNVPFKAKKVTDALIKLDVRKSIKDALTAIYDPDRIYYQRMDEHHRIMNLFWMEEESISVCPF